MEAATQSALEVLRGATRVMAFTGAGISTESGIPDFRGPEGVWKKVDPADFTFQKYVSDPETRKRIWRTRRDGKLLEAEPNDGHRALFRLWQADRLLGCVTQNIDGLHQAAGLPDEVVVEVHGNVKRCRCLECGRSWPMAEIIERVEEGDDDPHCIHCGGLIKVTVISFGEQMPAAEMQRAFRMAEECDAVLAVGSTLSVYPAADVPLEAARRGIPYIIINRGRTDHDHLADVRVEGGAGEVLTTLADALTTFG